MSLHTALLEAIDQHLSPESFLALFEAAESTGPLDTSGHLPLAVKLAQQNDVSDNARDAWVEVMERLLMVLPLSDTDVDKVCNAVFDVPNSFRMAKLVWTVLKDRMSVSTQITTLARCLRHGWADLMNAMLKSGCSTDLSQVRSFNSPFAYVTTVDDLTYLLDHGFDLDINMLDGNTGIAMLYSRGPSTFPKISMGAPHGPSARLALIRLAELRRPSCALTVRFEQALKHARGWNDFKQMLDLLGEDWLDVMLPNGASPLHAIVVRHPEFLRHVLSRPDVKARGSLWTDRLDHADRHPWSLIWLHRPPHAKTLAASVEEVERSLMASSQGREWLSNVPRQEGIEALCEAVSAALEWKCALPNFTDHAWWSWMEKRGNLNAAQSWGIAVHHPTLLEDLDRLIWDVLVDEPLSMHHQWFNVDLWSDDAHPWLATYRVLSSRLLWQPDALPGSAQATQHTFHLNRALQAMHEGADYEKIEALMASNRLSQRDDPSNLWHREVRTVWEQTVLRKTLPLLGSEKPKMPHRRL